MNAQDFLGLQPTHNPHRWVLPVIPRICTPGNFMFGGCGLASGIMAMEKTTKRPVIWATAQYLSYAKPPSIIDIDVKVPVTGKNVSQARAIAHVDDAEIITVNAALGQRNMPQEGAWAVRPDAPPPEDCEPLGKFGEELTGMPENVHDSVELRVARGLFGFWNIGNPTDDGRSLLWARIPDMEVSAATLAIIADFMPSGIGNALQMRAGGNSLDNTIRILNIEQSEWILCDIRVHGVHHGFGHGLMHLWSQNGTLLATASQSVILRVWEDGEKPR